MADKMTDGIRRIHALQKRGNLVDAVQDFREKILPLHQNFRQNARQKDRTDDKYGSNKKQITLCFKCRQGSLMNTEFISADNFGGTALPI